MRVGYRWQILLLFAGLFTVGWGVTSVVLSTWLSEEYEEALIGQARSLAENLAAWGEEAVLTENRVDLYGLAERTTDSNPDVIYVFLLDPRGQVMASSLGTPFPAGLASTTAGRDRTLLATEEGEVVDIRAPVLEGRGGEVHVGYSRRRLLSAVAHLETLVWGIALPVLVLGVAALWVIVGYVTRPATHLADVVRRFGSGDLDARSEVRGAEELQLLSTTFNGMADNLQQQAAELRFLTDYNQRLIDNLGAGLYVIDESLELEYANREMVGEVGGVCYETLYGRESPCPDCVARPALEDRTARRGSRSLPDGSTYEEAAIPIREASGRAAVIVVRRDVTEELELRRQRDRSERLAAVGELAAAVAHEVNNPLDGMRSILRLVAEDPSLPSGIEEHLELVQDGLARIEQCVRRLLTFAADTAEPVEVTELEHRVASALSLVTPTLERAGIEAVTDVAEDLPGVAIQPHRFDQLVVNLLLMAADSVPPGGRLGIRGLRGPDSTIVLTIENRGTGAPPTAGKRLFLPYFLQRGPDRESVLGLVVSRRIAEEHGGRVVVRDAPEGGAAYELRLPQAVQAAPSQAEEITS